MQYKTICNSNCPIDRVSSVETQVRTYHSIVAVGRTTIVRHLTPIEFRVLQPARRPNTVHSNVIALGSPFEMSRLHYSLRYRRFELCATGEAMDSSRDLIELRSSSQCQGEVLFRLNCYLVQSQIGHLLSMSPQLLYLYQRQVIWCSTNLYLVIFI